MIMKRVGPVLVLALTSAMTAEYLLGDQYLSKQGVGQQLAALALFVLFYGSAAVLIREVVRRRGLGWPSLLCLALGFGIAEEGLVTQSLFNPDYAGQHLLSLGYLPSLGIGAVWTIFVLTLHVVWSIGSPIALVEANAGTAPRLGRVGLVITTGCLLIGAAGTFAANLAMSPTRFLASPYQLAGAFVFAVIMITAGLLLPHPAGDHREGGTKRLAAAVLVGLVATSCFQLARQLDHPAWLVCLAMIAPLVAGAWATRRWGLPAAGLTVGALLTYAWVGLGNAVRAGRAEALEQSVIVLAYLVVLAVTLIRTARRAAGRRLLAQHGAVAQPVRAGDS